MVEHSLKYPEIIPKSERATEESASNETENQTLSNRDNESNRFCDSQGQWAGYVDGHRLNAEQMKNGQKEDNKREKEDREGMEGEEESGGLEEEEEVQKEEEVRKEELLEGEGGVEKAIEEVDRGKIVDEKENDETEKNVGGGGEGEAYEDKKRKIYKRRKEISAGGGQEEIISDADRRKTVEKDGKDKADNQCHFDPDIVEKVEKVVGEDKEGESWQTEREKGNGLAIKESSWCNSCKISNDSAYNVSIKNEIDGSVDGGEFLFLFSTRKCYQKEVTDEYIFSKKVMNLTEANAYPLESNSANQADVLDTDSSKTFQLTQREEEPEVSPWFGNLKAPTDSSQDVTEEFQNTSNENGRQTGDGEHFRCYQEVVGENRHIISQKLNMAEVHNDTSQNQRSTDISIWTENSSLEVVR